MEKKYVIFMIIQVDSSIYIYLILKVKTEDRLIYCHKETNSFSFSLFSFGFFGLDVLVVLVFDLIEFLHILPEILVSLQSNQQFSSLHEPRLVLLVILIFSLVATRFLNFNRLRHETNVVGVSIPYELLCSNYTD